MVKGSKLRVRSLRSISSGRVMGGGTVHSDGVVGGAGSVDWDCVLVAFELFGV